MVSVDVEDEPIICAGRTEYAHAARGNELHLHLRLTTLGQVIVIIIAKPPVAMIEAHFEAESDIVHGEDRATAETALGDLRGLARARIARGITAIFARFIGMFTEHIRGAGSRDEFAQRVAIEFPRMCFKFEASKVYLRNLFLIDEQFLETATAIGIHGHA